MRRRHAVDVESRGRQVALRAPGGAWYCSWPLRIQAPTMPVSRGRKGRSVSSYGMPRVGLDSAVSRRFHESPLSMS